jgi:hypothetical protein
VPAWPRRNILNRPSRVLQKVAWRRIPARPDPPDPAQPGAEKTLACRGAKGKGQPSRMVVPAGAQAARKAQPEERLPAQPGRWREAQPGRESQPSRGGQTRPSREAAADRDTGPAGGRGRGPAEEWREARAWRKRPSRDLAEPAQAGKLGQEAQPGHAQPGRGRAGARRSRARLAAEEIFWPSYALSRSGLLYRGPATDIPAWAAIIRPRELSSGPGKYNSALPCYITVF